MLSLSRRQFSAGALTEMVVFAACCITTMLLAVLLHLGPYGVPSQSVFIPAVEFAAIMTSLGVIFALFRVGEPKSLTVVFIRTIVVLAVGFPIAYAAFGYAPGGSTARQVLGSASLYALASVVLIRAAASMVLESGVGLQRIGPRRSVVVGFYPTGTEDTPDGRPAAGEARLFPRSIELPAIIERFQIDEVIIAVREQRGGVLPIRELLECRISGVPVRDSSTL